MTLAHVDVQVLLDLNRVTRDGGAIEAQVSITRRDTRAANRRASEPALVLILHEQDDSDNDHA